MSTAFELQIYQNGQWQFDSYFDDKESVVSEAERMNSSGRYAGVRVLEETYKDNSNTCEYHVIFSRLGKDAGPSGNWRDRYQGAQPAGSAAEEREPVRRAKPRAAAPRKSNTGMLILLASLLLVVGVGAMIALHTLGGRF